MDVFVQVDLPFLKSDLSRKQFCRSSVHIGKYWRNLCPVPMCVDVSRNPILHDVRLGVEGFVMYSYSTGQDSLGCFQGRSLLSRQPFLTNS